WGQRLSLRGDLRQPLLDLRAPGDHELPWHNWSGELFADFAQVDVSRLKAYLDLSEWGVSVRSGQGALRAWADLDRGRIASATADLNLRQIATRLGAELPELAIDTLQGRLSARWDGAGFELATDQLRFRTTDGLDWPGGALKLTHRQAGRTQSASSEFTADRLDL